MSDSVTDWQEGEVMRFAEREPDRSYVHDDPITIEIEARLARIEGTLSESRPNCDSVRIELLRQEIANVDTKQDALYAEIHAVRLAFAELTEGVAGAIQSNPLLRRFLGGGK